MTTVTANKESFRLSMLLNDTRYRSATLQVIAAVLLALAFGYLYSNLAENLRAAGLNISFAFLGTPSGYDINQTLIDYNSQSTNLRAAFVGILNTLLVAFLACITATVFGVLAGVLRLSNNWLVRKLMAVYVEIFRNIPVLIWIVIIFTIMIAVMPGPREFRGDNATSSMLFEAIAFTNRGVYVPAIDFSNSLGTLYLNAMQAVSGLQVFSLLMAHTIVFLGIYFFGERYLNFIAKAGLLTFPFHKNPMKRLWIVFGVICAFSWLFYFRAIPSLTERADSVGSFGINLDLIALFATLSISLVICRALGKWATQRQVVTGIRPTLWHLQLGIAVFPILFAAYLLGFHLTYPELKGFNFSGGLKVGGPLIALWFALSIYTGAFIAENVRAGIQAVSKGQTEAASALGLRPGRVMSLVVLPQALRVIIPPLISQYLNITKNSSLAIAVGYADITATLGGITLNQTGRAIECVLLLMAFYLVISLLISAFMNVYNNAMKLKER